MKTSILTHVFCHSPAGIPIFAHTFTGNGAEVLILGGVHGDEIEGVIAANKLLEHFTINYDYKLNITIIPMFNIDGVLNKNRQNSNGIDLNRNLPTKDWTSEVSNPRYFPGKVANSEPENQALTAYLEQKKPKMIFSLHSWQPLLNINGDCLDEAKVISSHTGYKIEEDIGYPTPGCLGSYAGLERHYPTLTYEIERGLNAEKIISVHVPAILDALKETERKH